jgi:hypothetical protein
LSVTAAAAEPKMKPRLSMLSSSIEPGSRTRPVFLRAAMLGGASGGVNRARPRHK